MPILGVELIGGLPKGFRQRFGSVRPENSLTFPKIVNFAASSINTRKQYAHEYSTKSLANFFFRETTLYLPIASVQRSFIFDD